MRAYSRCAFNDPDHHLLVRQQIVTPISQNQAILFLYVSNGFNNEQIHILCYPTRYYHSLQQHLQLMSRPDACAGYIEIAAGQQLYNVSINVIVAGTAALPSVPHPPFHDNVRVLYHPQSMHYSTLAPNYFEVLRTSFCIIITLQLFFLISTLVPHSHSLIRLSALRPRLCVTFVKLEPSALASLSRTCSCILFSYINTSLIIDSFGGFCPNCTT